MDKYFHQNCFLSIQTKLVFSYIWLLLLVISSFTIVSCNKIPIQNPPDATILFPAPNQIIVVDSVLIQAFLHADQGIEYIRAGLTDQNGVAAVASQVVYAQIHDTLIDFVFRPDKISIRGSMKAWIVVSDGFQEKRVEQNLLFQPELSYQTFFVTASNVPRGIVLKMWNEFGLNISTHQLSGKRLAEISTFPLDRNMYLRLQQPSQIMAFDPLHAQLVWTNENSFLPYNTFSALYAGKSMIWVSDKVGLVQGISKSDGRTKVTSTLQPDTITYLLSDTEEFLFAAQTLPPAKYFLSVFHTSTGQRFYTEQMNAPIISIIPTSTNELIVVLNSERKTQILLFDIETLSYHLVAELPEKILEKALLLKQMRLLGIADHHLVIVDVFSGELNVLNNDYQFIDLIGGQQNKVIYAYGNSNLTLLSADGFIIDHIIFDESFDFFKVMYSINK